SRSSTPPATSSSLTGSPPTAIYTLSLHDALPIYGNRMTYYGRWTYKFEEAARQGAAAALIIHDDEGASYGWDVVKNSWSGPQFEDRKSTRLNSSHVKISYAVFCLKKKINTYT